MSRNGGCIWGGMILAGLMVAPNGWAESPPSGQSNEVVAPQPQEFSFGQGIFGLELGVGSNQGANVSQVQGAQIGMRFLLMLKDVSARMDALMGGRMGQGLMGESRFVVDTQVAPPKHSGMVWGWWGAEFAMIQTPTFWHSLVEIPRVHWGVRSFGPRHGLELGVRVGYTLIGRYNPEDVVYRLGNSLTPAVYGALSTEHLSMALDWRTFRSFDRGHRVDQGEVLLCGTHGEMAFCATGRSFRAYSRSGDAGWEQPTSSWQMGLMLGMGDRLGLPAE